MVSCNLPHIRKPELLEHGITFLQNNASHQQQSLLQACSWEVMAWLPYSLKLSPYNNFLFDRMKKPLQVKKEVKTSLSTQWRHIESRGILHSFFIFALDAGKWSASNPSCFIYPLRKRPWYPQNWQMDVLKNHFGSFGKEKPLLQLPQIKPQLFDGLAHSLVIIPTTISWLPVTSGMLT